MESPPPPSASRPDALDALEQRAVDLLGGADDAAWDALLAEIDHAGLSPHPPPIDPFEARGSSSELRRLIDALRGASPQPPTTHTRAGYEIDVDRASILPAFAAALGTGSLREFFPDLWAVDAALWENLDRPTAWDHLRVEVGDLPDVARTPLRARLWLESPGRRLVQDIGALRHAPGPLGASDLSRHRLARAAGVGVASAADWPAFQELHAAVPGAALATWKPHTDGELVVRALKLLEDGSPIGLRGAALAWLLDRAASDPVYSVEGIAHDLREDLPVRLGVALPAWLGGDRETVIARDLETLALQHAARIVANDTATEATREAWSLARWLQRCLTLSPFLGSDEELLGARLRSLLPERVAVPEGADALHPARFRLDESGLNVAEIAFVSGVLAHYLRAPAPVLLPTPVPLVKALLTIAERPVRPAEDKADEARAAGRNALGWPEGYPIAAPLAARKLMTELRIGWVAEVGEDAQLESIERFARDPRGQEGVAFALHRESAKVSAKARRRAAEVFEELDKRGAAEPHVLATFGVSALPEIDDAAARRILDLAMRADPAWRPFVADALAGAADQPEREALWKEAMERLLRLMEDTRLDEKGKTRLNAALFALRRATASKLPSRDEILERFIAIAQRPPFTDHAGLRREIRRLSPPAAAGSKR